MAADRLARAALVTLLGLGCGESRTLPPEVTSSTDIGGTTGLDGGLDGGALDDGGANLPLPQGLVAESAPLYRFDATRADVTISIAGDAAHRLIGRLRDAQGRRELLYDDASIAAPGWHLPPVAAASPGGETLVCFSTLTGEHSAVSSPGAPDPSTGMSLTCLLRDATGAWGQELSVSHPTPGAWLQRVEAQADGTFRVRFYGDDGYLVGPRREGHGVYEVIVRGGSPSPPVLVIPATDPTGPAGEERVSS
jgi:hypothetical protein